ncbi:molecular chaperone [Dyella sp. ASV21]|jgi:fimbrial chaperone protein|uniref:fimbrial biogenesis chaperone n=1 Tax=Dyella sp. ASV21 TaxID=2795114 RepID=UPI0018EBC7C2|nr:molecular chaperone [Dyella sp. ASV21]
MRHLIAVLSMQLVLAWIVPAQAASLQISPVAVSFSSRQHATTVTLRNPGNDPLFGQIRVFAWDQRDGSDQLDATTELLATPPIVKIPAGGEQVVRLVMAQGAADGRERSYRLIVDEVPDPSLPRINGVVMRMRYSIPVFVAGDERDPAPALSWTLTSDGSGVHVHVSNRGQLHAQIADMKIVDQGGHVVTGVGGLAGYALRGRERLWRLTAGPEARQGPLTVHALVNGRESSFPIPAE